MKKYCAGSHLAFGKLYQRHKAASYRYFLRQCRNHHQAEDLLQELWSRVIKSQTSYRHTALFTTWFYRIAHNLLVDHHKHLTLVNSVVSSEPEEALDLHPNASPEQNMLAQQQRQQLLILSKAAFDNRLWRGCSNSAFFYVYAKVSVEFPPYSIWVAQ